VTVVPLCRCRCAIVPFCVDVTCRPQLALRALLVEDDRLEAAALLWHESSWETDRSLLRKKSLATLHSSPPKSALLSPAKSVVGLQSVMQSPVGALIARALVVCHRYLPHVTRLPLCLWCCSYLLQSSMTASMQPISEDVRVCLQDDLTSLRSLLLSTAWLLKTTATAGPSAGTAAAAASSACV
jgi:hypothetical protein